MLLSTQLMLLGVLGTITSCATIDTLNPARRPDPVLLQQYEQQEARVKALPSANLRCAPEDVGVAQTNDEFARLELSRGNNDRAKQHLAIASGAIDRAARTTLPCPTPAAK
jgi:hypothetical protein